MDDIEARLAGLAGRPPFPPTPLDEITRRGRTLVRRRRARFGIALVLAVGLALVVGTIAFRSPGTNGRRVDVTGPTTGTPVTDAAAWRGHGNLAFVSEGQLWILGDRGQVRRVPGPGLATAPAWSSDGRWVAFLRTPSAPAGKPYVGEPSRLWVAAADGARAHAISAPGLDVEEFAWRPRGNSEGAGSLAYVAVAPQGHAASEVVLASPVGASSRRLVVQRLVPTMAWAPSGAVIAVTGALRSSSSGVTGAIRLFRLGDGTSRVVATSPGNTLELAGWWPDGAGLIYWVDRGGSASLVADGANLDSVDLSSGAVHALALTLTYANWLSWSPDGHTLAVVAGDNRSVWDGGKHLDLCIVPAATCTEIAQPSNRVSLDPAWTASGKLVFTRAPGTRSQDMGPPPGTGRTYRAGWGPAALAAWNGRATLWTLKVDTRDPQPVRAAGRGAHDATAVGPALLYVRRDDLWLLGPAGTRPEIIVRSLGTTDRYEASYYGYVDWSADLARHR
jgi:Tol biopolymer transport system component